LELSRIYRSIQADLDLAREKLMSICDIDFPWLSEQLRYVMAGGGKGMRPALTLLCGKFYHYDLTYLLPMAVSLELMHTSTLVHDDAIDRSFVRRGQPTINQIWGEDIAILMGDYLFAKAGEFVSDTRTPRVIKLFSQTLGIISSGEIKQFLNIFNLKQTREDYIQRIAGKTASLFALSTQSGAILSRAPEKAVKLLRDYGYHVGIAFQIVDDILDFIGDEETLGKPVGSDLTQGNLTLPAMLIMERYPADNPVSRIFTSRDGSDRKALAEAIDIVKNSAIKDDCYRLAADYRSRACAGLAQLPEHPAAEALAQLADYVVTRRV